LRVVIAQVRADGIPRTGTQRWSRGHQPAGGTNFTVFVGIEELEVRLQYSVSGHVVMDVIALTMTPSNLPGNPGRRVWWRCPCGRRAAVLYSPGTYWRCRFCTHVTYTSSNESDRRVSALRRAGPDAIAQLDPGLPDPTWGTEELAHWLRHATPRLTLQMKALKYR
jgi:hypothetical protein